MNANKSNESRDQVQNMAIEGMWSKALMRLSEEQRSLIERLMHERGGSIGVIEWDRDRNRQNKGILSPVTIGTSYKLHYQKLNSGDPSLCRALIESHDHDLYVPDVSKDSRYQEGLSSTKSEYVVRLGTKEHVLGVLDAQLPLVDGFATIDRAALDSLAEAITVELLYDHVIQAEQFIDNVGMCVRALDSLNSDPTVGVKLDHSLRDEFKRKILVPVEKLNRYGNNARVIYCRHDAEGTLDLRDAISSGRIPKLAEGEIFSSRSDTDEDGKPSYDSMVGAAAHLKEIQWVNDVEALETSGDRRFYIPESKAYRVYFAVDSARKNVRSAVAVPVMSEDTDVVHGVLYADHETPYAFSPKSRKYLEAIAAVLSIALDDIKRISNLQGLGAGFTAASVMARNLAHHIGSHVLTYLIADLDQGLILNIPGDEPDPKFAGEREAIRDLLAHIRDRVLFAAVQPHALFGTSGSFDLRNRLIGIYNPTEKTSVNYLTENLVRSKLGRGQNKRAFVNFKPISITDTAIASVPLGQLGIQAICAIIENLLRNAGNYSVADEVKRIQEGKSKLDLDVKVSGDWEAPHDVAIEDTKLSMWQNKFVELRIWDRSVKAEDFDVTALKLDRKVTAYGGEAGGAAGNLGLLEIKLCAAFLRSIAPKDVDRHFEQFLDYKGSEPPLVYVNLNDRRQLEYRFYLPRPRHVLWITDRHERDIKKIQHKALEGGVLVMHIDDVIRDVKGNQSMRDEIAVVDCSPNCAELGELIEWAEFLPYRLLVREDIRELWSDAVQQQNSSLHTFGVDEETVDELWHGISMGDVETSDNLLSIYVRSSKQLRDPSGYVLCRFNSNWCFPEAGFVCVEQATWSTYLSPNGKSGPTKQGAEKDAVDFVRSAGIESAHVYDHEVIFSRNERLYSGAQTWDALVDGFLARQHYLAIVGQVAIGAEEMSAATKGMIARLYESSLCKVVIVDDRLESMKSYPVSDSASEKLRVAEGNEDEISLDEAWRRRSVLFRSERELIELVHGSESPDEVVAKILGGDHADFLLIHQQVLKTLRTHATGEKIISEKRLDGIIDRLAGCVGRTVVHTSTGEVNPAYVAPYGMKNVPWLSYNEVQDIILRRGKFELVASLCAIRGVNRPLES